MTIHTCFVTGKTYSRGVFGIHEHHYIRQQEYKKNPKWFEDQGLKQKVFWLWYEVHGDLHSAMSDERFLAKWRVERRSLLFNHKDWVKNNACFVQDSLL